MSQKVDGADLKFLHDKKVRSEYRINIPENVVNFLFDQGGSKDNVFHWNYDKKADILMLANHTPREDRSVHIKYSQSYNSTSTQTKIPKEAADRVNININDCIYLWTHTDMKLASNPSVYVSKRDIIDELMIEQKEEKKNEFLRLPNF